MWFATKDAKAFLNKNLSLKATGNEQDWEVELSNHLRIGEFIEFLENEAMDRDIEKALVALILSSFDDSLNNGSFKSELWERFSVVISKDINLFRDVMSNWISADDDDEFSVSALIRRVIF